MRTPDGKIAQAGAIACRTADEGLLVLIVRAKKTPEHWIFPKGHIEAGESAEEAALRELEEEAGIRAEVLEAAGATEYPRGGEAMRVEYFFCRYVADAGKGDGRETRWCSPEEAEKLLSFSDLRRMARKAKRI
jgi:8-oxo-dGTP pyrophosphatase MutT (NUDIX family)